MAELDIQKILDALHEEDVEFLVIGGVAVGFHGYVRATKDIDIVPSPSDGNLERLARVLGRLDAEVEGAVRWIGDEELWGKLSPTALTAEIGGIAVKVVDYESLVALKRQAGRPEDLTDLQKLQQARGEGR